MVPGSPEDRNRSVCLPSAGSVAAGNPGAQGPGTGCEAHLGPAEELSAEVRRFAERHLQGTRGSHAWDHTLRVCRLGGRIACMESADALVVLLAAYLHDIGRGRQDASRGRVCHALLGAQLAAPLVARLPLSGAQRENILHSIRTHRFRGDCRPRTLEARVLFDADKLDAIGAVGIARAYLFAGEIGARLHNGEADIARTRAYSREDTGYREYRLKLCRIRERMLTSAGRQLAEERHRFMEVFFNRFLLEYEGRG